VNIQNKNEVDTHHTASASFMSENY